MGDGGNGRSGEWGAPHRERVRGSVEVPLDLGGWKIVSAKLSDRLSDYRPHDFAGVMPPESFVLLKCENNL